MNLDWVSAFQPEASPRRKELKGPLPLSWCHFMLQASGFCLVSCFVVAFKYRYLHKNNAMLKRSVYRMLPQCGCTKKNKVLWLCGMVTAGMQLPDMSIEVFIGQALKEKNLFF